MVRASPPQAPAVRLWGRPREERGILMGTSGLAWVIVSALVLRGLAWFHYDPVSFDSAIYFELAALIQSGRWAEALAHDYPPLYPLLIAGLEPVVGTYHATGLLIAFGANLLILAPIHGIARRAVGDDAAWAAAFLWAVHLSAVRLGVQALSDAPLALCVAIALFAGIRAVEQSSALWAWSAGVSSGLAFLLRPEGLEPALGLAVFYAFDWHQAGRETLNAAENVVRATHVPVWQAGSALETPRRQVSQAPVFRPHGAVRRVGWMLAPLTGWVLVAGPYVAYISAEAGALTLSKKKSAMSFVRSVDPLPSVARQVSEIQPAVEPQPARRSGETWAHRAARGLYAFQKPVVNGLTAVIIIPGCVGLLGVLTRRRGRWNPPLGLLTGLFMLHLGILIGLAADKGASYVGRHHALLLVVYALPIAGAGLVWALEWMGDRLGSHRWIPAIVLCAIVVATGSAVVTRGPDHGNSLRTAAAWIRSQVGDRPVIATSLAKLTYHASAERVDIGGTYDQILQRARDRSAHFIALYPDLMAQTSPDFLARVDPADVELVKVFPERTPQAPDQRLELYRVRPQETRVLRTP